MDVYDDQECGAVEVNALGFGTYHFKIIPGLVVGVLKLAHIPHLSSL